MTSRFKELGPSVHNSAFLPVRPFRAGFVLAVPGTMLVPGRLTRPSVVKPGPAGAGFSKGSQNRPFGNSPR